MLCQDRIMEIKVLDMHYKPVTCVFATPFHDNFLFMCACVCVCVCLCLYVCVCVCVCGGGGGGVFHGTKPIMKGCDD